MLLTTTTTLVLLLRVSQLAEGELAYQSWRSPNLAALKLYGRQRGDGYNPEFGTCGVGQTCAEACGDDFTACSADVISVLFCYNPGAGQTCCPGGTGRACDANFYCAKEPDGGLIYCCDETADLAQCASDLGASTLVPAASTASSTVTTPRTSSSSSSSSTTMTTSHPASTRSSTAISTKATSTTTGSSHSHTPTSGAIIPIPLPTTSRSTNSTTTRSPTPTVVTAGAPSSSVGQMLGMVIPVLVWAAMG